jgi:hypothetical protein
MLEPSAQSRKVQWKWVGISMVLYATFYLLPLVIFSAKAEALAFIWLFAGIIVVASITGYLSEGVTIIEPAIAGAGLMFLFAISMMAFIPRQIDFIGVSIGMAIVMVVVFLLSLLGAWLGERAQKLWRKGPTEQAQGQ